jgi:hypothetical protein
MIMDEIFKMMNFLKVIKNDWNQPSPTFRTCDMDHKSESQRKRQT